MISLCSDYCLGRIIPLSRFGYGFRIVNDLDWVKAAICYNANYATCSSFLNSQSSQFIYYNYSTP